MTSCPTSSGRLYPRSGAAPSPREAAAAAPRSRGPPVSPATRTWTGSGGSGGTSRRRGRPRCGCWRSRIRWCPRATRWCAPSACGLRSSTAAGSARTCATSWSGPAAGRCSR
ncbi:unnamed protein product, partial [Ectocarpus sp. 12 AP-2014]